LSEDGEADRDETRHDTHDAEFTASDTETEDEEGAR